MKKNDITENNLLLEIKREGRMCVITARYGDETLHCDRIDIQKASSRERFITDMLKAAPGLDRKTVSDELLRLAGETTGQNNGKENTVAEPLDLSKIVRPELFHTRTVSGILVPVVYRDSQGEVAAKWVHYLRWHGDKRREIRDFQRTLELPDGTCLYFDKEPPAPTPRTTSGWSAHGRERWLAGEECPYPVALFRQTCERFKHFLEMPVETRTGTIGVFALWTLFSYIFPVWSALPYLSIGGTRQSGKSRTFEVLREMVFRPLPTSNTTGACLYRTLDQYGGTLLCDEAETLSSNTPESAALRSILLAGYTAGTPARRLEPRPDGRFDPVEFCIYGPKCFSAITALPDTLADRSIPIMMFRANEDSQKPRRRIDENPEQWQMIRDGLHVIALEYGDIWFELANRPDVCPPMYGREFQKWQPLLALAAWLESLGGEGYLTAMQEHAVKVNESGREDGLPPGDEILLQLLALETEAGNVRHMTVGELLSKAKAEDESLFKKWSAHAVGRAVRRYGIAPVKSHGRRVFRNVTPEQIRQIEKAYAVRLLSQSP